MMGAIHDGKGINGLLAEPMSAGQFAASAASLIALGTIYCQIYCSTAYHPMHGAVMPLRFSFVWAVGAVLPWLACFELCKPVRLPATRLLGWLMIGICFAGAALLSIVLELGMDQLVMAHTRPLPMQVAAQLPAAALVGTFLILGRGSSPGRPSETIAGEPLAEVLNSSGTIDWVEAAGNYVEVHAGGRTSLHRVTMSALEEALDPAAFRRIHRSTIVALGAVEAHVLLRGSPAVRLRDGSLLKVGSRYARNLKGSSA